MNNWNWREADLYLDENGNEIDIKQAIEELENDWLLFHFILPIDIKGMSIVVNTFYGTKDKDNKHLNHIQNGIEALSSWANLTNNQYVSDYLDSEEFDIYESQVISKYDLIAEDAKLFEDDIEFDVQNNFKWDRYNHELENPDQDMIHDNELWGDKIASLYIGTIFNLTPSGKFYTPFACSNVTDFEIEKDEIFWEKMNIEAEKINAYITYGEGDPCDVYINKVWEGEVEEEE